MTEQRTEATVRTPDGKVIPLHAPQGSGLAPVITTDNAREMAQRSHESRRANKEKAEKDMAELVAAARALRLELPARGELSGMAEAIVLKMAVQVLTGELAPRSAAEATNIAKAWSEIFRLEQGTPTAITEFQNQAEMVDRLTEYRERAAARGGMVIPAKAEEQP